jgi:hypothetical protein
LLIIFLLGGVLVAVFGEFLLREFIYRLGNRGSKRADISISGEYASKRAAFDFLECKGRVLLISLQNTGERISK